MNKKNGKRKKTLILTIMILISLILVSIIFAELFYYNPSSTITQEWYRGTGNTHTEIVDNARQPSAPSTGSFVASRMSDGHVSEFRFPTVTETPVENITLWVYTSTGNTATYTFSLRQGATTRCSNTVPGGVGASWRSCTWNSPSGDLSDLRIHLSVVDRFTGGGPTNAIVYAAYLSIDTGPAFPTVTLSSPNNDNIITGTPINFSFTVTDPAYSTLTCSLYGNFSGTWQQNETMSATNNTLTTFSITPGDNYYVWNVLCQNAFGRSSFAQNNRTVYVNRILPSFNNAALNESIIRQNRQVRFNVSITDSYGISAGKVTLRYPNATETEYDLLNSGSEYYYVFTNTAEEGTYEVINVWANDTLGQTNNYNLGLSFEVQAIAPGEINLISPANETESQILNPEMTWTETDSPDFKNYTLQISKQSNFGIIEFEYYTTTISNTFYFINNLDDNSLYYWRVIAYDTFNNQKISNQVYTYITDNIAPSVTLNNPSNNAFSNNLNNVFYFTPTDTNTIDYCSLYSNSSGSWIIENQTHSVIKNNQNTLSMNGVEGHNSWNVQCYDEAGNSAFASQNHTLIIDLTPPSIELISPSNNSLLNNSNIVSFQINASDELSNIAECSLIINETNYQTQYDIINNEIYEFMQFLNNNYYEWQVSCTDTNNWEYTTPKKFFTLNVTVDNDPPVINLNFPTQNYYSNTDSIIFDYYVKDASGIENCTLYINNVFQDFSYEVTNFANNNFSINDIPEAQHNWTIMCYDASAEKNQGTSTTRNFWVDLTNPNLTLNTPTNNSSFNYSNINFNYVPVDTNLNYCALYTNITGSWVETARETPTNNEENTFNEQLPNGFFIWNVLCVDLSTRESFAQQNRTINIDAEAPKYYNITISPTTPSIYEENQIHYFNITWTDNQQISVVKLEQNFSGTITNQTITVYDDYNFSTTLNAGNYYYKWYANDSLNNKNSTNTFYYEVSKKNSTINLYLNTEENNITINENTFVNITGTITAPENGELTLYKNQEIINQQNSIVYNNTFFENPGTYNISLNFSGNNNYNPSTKNFFVTVLDITDPAVTLISPVNDTQIASGTVLLQYNMTDFSNITSCSLYINNTLNETNNEIEKNTLQFFSIELEENTYSWRVQCTDSYNNIGISETRTFEAVDAKYIIVELTINESSYEEGEPFNISTKTEDMFDNALLTNVETSTILGETNIPWWNSSWLKRKKIIMNETTGLAINGIARINLTNLEISSCQELRFVKHEGADINESLFFIHSSGINWCDVSFEVMLESNEVNNENYYVYYNNSEALTPTSLNMITSSLFNANVAAIDQTGTVTNINNVIGKNDVNYATLTASGGGEVFASGHGRNFVNQALGEIQKVEIRYRYEVPVRQSGTWSLRYSTNAGTSYTNAHTGISTVSKTTSSWLDITNAYSSLTWTNVNNTRLQGHVTKSGGGATITMYLYWLELNVTHNKTSQITQITSSETENLIAYNKENTNINGLSIWETIINEPGNYSIISRATRNEFENAKNHTTIEIIIDVNNPEVIILSPVNQSKLNRGNINFTYEVFDHNIETCTLYLGVEELNPNITLSVSNGINTFENIYLTYEDYLWNVRCIDKRNNYAFSEENFSFTIIVPDSETEAEIIGENITITWIDNIEADNYSIYTTNDFVTGFPLEPTTVITSNSFSENVSEISKKFYKITTNIGGRSSEGILAGIYTQELNEGFNMISLPFYLKDYELKTIEGFSFATDMNCILSLWNYDDGLFKKTDWIENSFVPSTGSEDFTTIDSTKGYFIETNTSCTLRIGGLVPINEEIIQLNEDLNLVSWLSVEEKNLTTGEQYSILETTPEYAISHIYYYNASKEDYDFTTFMPSLGWWVNLQNSHFTKLNPMKSYFFLTTTSAEWNHQP